MENGSIVLAILVAGYFGRKNILLGGAAGSIISILFYFLVESNPSMSFAEELFLGNFVSNLVIGFVVSFIVAAFINYIPVGLRGGDHNRSPYYLGGGDNASGRGGIIYTDEDIKAKNDNARRIP